MNPTPAEPTTVSPTDAYNAELISRDDVTDQHAILRVRFTEGIAEPPTFEPGQHTQLGLVVDPSEDEVAARKGRPRLARRTYSVASSPRTAAEFLEFYVLRVPQGRFSTRLAGLRAGDPLFVDRRFAGKLTLEGVPPGKDLVCVATGTGLAPFMSMLKAYRGRERWNRFIVIHGTRLAADLGYRGELERIAAEDRSVVYLPTVTREPDESDWSGLRGRVHALLEPEIFARSTGVALLPETCHIFLCGNPAMVDECEADLVRRGFTVRDRHNPQGNLHFERYW